jgi:hypothetical protein
VIGASMPRSGTIVRVVAVVLCVCLGALLGLGQGMAAVALVALVLLVAAQMAAPRSLFALGIVVALLPVLTSVPAAVNVGGSSVYFSDLLLPGGLVLALLTSRRPPHRRLGLPFVVLAGIGAVALAIGLVNRTSPSLIVNDLRGPLYLLLSYAGAVLLFREEDRRPVFVVLAVIMCSTAVLVLAESIMGWHLLGGRVEAAFGVEAGRSASEADATRFLVGPTNLALLLLCMAVVFMVRGAPWRRWVRFVPFLFVPSVVLVFLAFSRRSLLALAVTLLVVLVASSFLTSVIRSLLVAMVLLALLVGGSAIPVASNSYLGKQIHAFSDRVVSGSTADARQQDLGLAWRDTEDRYAFSSFVESPLLGSGLGAQYRPFLLGEPFTAATRDLGRTYLHNFYLGLLVKTGLMGLLAFLLFFGGPVVRAIGIYRSSRRSRATLTFALAASLVGLAAINVYAPVFNENATAVVLGCALGFLQTENGKANRAVARRSVRVGAGSSGPAPSASAV